MTLHLPPAALRKACHAWETGGCLALGLFFGKFKPHFGVKDYAELVALVRRELNDTTDYSEGSTPMARPNEYEVPEGARPMICRSCGMGMVFIKTAAGKMMPLSVATIEERDGKRYALPHFADCAQSKEWSKKR